MQTATPTLRKILLPVFFTLACFALSLGLFKTFGGKVPFSAKPYEATVVVPSGDAIYAGSDIRMAGVRIGRVRKVSNDGRRTTVVLGINADYAPLGTQVKATVRSKSLLGEGYIELAPGSDAVPRLRDGGRIANANVVPTQRLDDVLQTFSPSARASFRRFTRGMDGAFRGRASDVNDILGRAPAFAGNLEQVADELRDQASPIQDLLANSERVFGTIGSRSNEVQEAITQGNRVLATTASRDRALQNTITTLPGFLTDLRAASSELGGASRDINVAVSALRPTAPLVAPAVQSITAKLPAFQKILDKIRPTLLKANVALPSTTRILNGTREPLSPTYDALREIIPFVDLASANTKTSVAFFSNVAGLVNGRAILGSTGYRGATAAGMLSIWNEIIGGYTKKLPTNTSNPYPQPGATERLATQRTLPAFDCRNGKNALIVPSTGSTPPCITQGPYTFRGKKAYYPRLLREAP